MKDIWKFVAITILILSLIGTLFSLKTESELKDKIIELQEKIPDTIQINHTDTIYFDSVVVKWKTSQDTTEFIIRDTFLVNDTVTIVQTEICPLDSFSVNETYQDSIIEANVYIEGRGVYEKTFLDTMNLRYKINTEALVPKKKCCWLRRIFCRCE